MTDGVRQRPGGEFLWSGVEVGSENMRAGKRIFCGIMAGILMMMEPMSGYARRRNQ